MSVEVKPKSYSFATYTMKISSAYFANRLSHPDHMEPRQKKSYFLSFFFLLNAKLIFLNDPSFLFLWSTWICIFMKCLKKKV